MLITNRLGYFLNTTASAQHLSITVALKQYYLVMNLMPLSLFTTGKANVTAHTT